MEGVRLPAASLLKVAPTHSLGPLRRRVFGGGGTEAGEESLCPASERQGLERRVCILAGLDDMEEESAGQLLYVGITRAALT